MPAAIITHIAAVDPAANNARAAAQAEKAKAAADVYRQQCDRLKARHPDYCTDAVIRQIEGGWHGWLPGVSHHADYRHYKDAVRAAESAAQIAARAVASPAKIRIAVIQSFDVKDMLKALGYRFDKEGYWNDFAGLKVTAAWVKDIPSENHAAMQSEIQHLSDMGVDIRMDADLNHIVAGLRAAINSTP